jgi:putative endonuclease
MTPPLSINPHTRSVDTGIDAEALAERYLTARGLALIERNHRSRFGEIDLIMSDGDVVIFVEVRLRRSSAYGGAAASIDYRKQRKLATTARHWLGRFPREPACRFDAVLLDGMDWSRIEWVRNIMS